MTGEPRPVRRALRELDQAKADERALHDRVVAGDTTVDAADLAEAEAAVRLAALRVESARRIVAEDEQRREAPRIAGQNRRRVARLEAHQAEQAERRRAEIDRGVHDAWIVDQFRSRRRVPDDMRARLAVLERQLVMTPADRERFRDAIREVA